MATLEELKRELARKKAEEEVREDMRKRDMEKRQVQGELRRIKYAKSYGFARKVGRGAVIAGKVVSSIGQDVKRVSTKRAPVRRTVRRRTTVRRAPVRRTTKRRTVRRYAPVRRRTTKRRSAPTKARSQGVTTKEIFRF